MDGSEGRKDPFLAMYCHLPKAPSWFFYDFACKAEEYCLNRESGFFRYTRFFHDTFHGFSHKCPDSYSVDASLGHQANMFNTSIMEQFNAYLKNIKESAKQMNQANFTFHVQFLIDIWSVKNERALQKKKKLAAFL